MFCMHGCHGCLQAACQSVERVCVCYCKTNNNVRDSCRKEGPQALISVCGGSGRAVDASSKLVTVFDALGSGRPRSIEEEWSLVDFIYHLFFRACGPGPGDRCLGVVIQGLLEGLLWSDVDVGVEELNLGPEPTMGATGF